ncbi:MAG: tRNA (adenosine(37)-N6)-threonylcarbamoyltransferase complex ATPase subunit type 1 TsaE [Dictyoglomus sp.]
MVIRMKIISKSPSETRKIGKTLGRILKPKNILALIGDLGSGKTTFVQGIAEALEIPLPVNSPSFLILKEYKGKYKLLHADVYRLKEPEIELENIGFYEYLYNDYIVVIEWADRIKNLLSIEYLEIIFEHKNINERSISFSAHGERYEKLLREFEQCLSWE